MISLSMEQQLAIIQLANKYGLRVITQAVFPVDAMAAVAAGADEIIV